MPPVMGAAAFLMAEYVGISYADVVRHALLPALITYGALFYIVDIEAVKKGMTGLPRQRRRSFVHGLSLALLTFCGLVILAGAFYWGLGWSKTVFGAAASPIALLIVVAGYLALVANRARFPIYLAMMQNRRWRRCRISIRSRAPGCITWSRSRC